MNEELLGLIEREVLGWPGVWKKRDENGPGGIGVTGYRLGRPQIGHVHDDGHADFRFPKEVRDELIGSGRAVPHPAFPNSRTTASYQIRSAEDVPGAVELFRMNYERARSTAEQREIRQGGIMDGSKRAALITGASRGLGLALARRLANDGWSLLIDARGEKDLEAARAELAKKTRVVAIPGDVTDAAHRRALAEAARAFGGLDALVNNASILGPSPQPELLDYPLDAIERVYRANVFAPLALIQAVRDVLKPGARLLNITSDAAAEPYEGWGGYGSSKAALEQLSNILAAENPGLRVYRVDPGDMRTRMHQEAFPDEDISDRPLPEESVPGLVELLTGDLPSRRYEARALIQTREEAV